MLSPCLNCGNVSTELVASTSVLNLYTSLANLVPTTGLEPARLSTLGSRPSASANSATRALSGAENGTSNLRMFGAARRARTLDLSPTKGVLFQLSYSGICWCPEQDLNLHVFRHYALNVARLPVSPPGHCLSAAYRALPRLLRTKPLGRLA